MIIEQNKELLKHIADEEAIPYHELVKLIPKYSDVSEYLSSRHSENSKSPSVSSPSCSSSSDVEKS